MGRKDEYDFGHTELGTGAGDISVKELTRETMRGDPKEARGNLANTRV